MTSSQHERFIDLRMRAERLVQSINLENLQSSTENISELLHELQTYQIELELQNDELVDSQSKLEESRAEYRHLFEFAPVGYFIFNTTGIVLDANATGLEMLQVSRPRIINKPFLVYLEASEKARFAKHIQTTLISGERQVCDIMIKRKNGQVLYAEIQSIATIDDHTKESRIRTALLDISERHRLEEQLIAEREKALEGARFMNEFMANMSHEIRTPLAGVIGFAEVLEEELLNEQREIAQIIARGGTRLLNTLNSVLDFSRLQAQSPRVLLLPTNLFDCTRHQCRLLQPLAKQKGLSLIVEADEEEIFALVDTNFFERIINNLVSNAIKYTESGEIRVTLSVKNDLVELSVQDTGIGIEDASLALIFDPFRQEQMGNDRAYEGVGLGLSITKRLVDLMQGDITVQSDRGQGSRFTVRFLKLDHDLRFFAHQEAERKNMRPMEEFENCKLLVVEDNWETKLLVERLLKPLCFVKTVSTFDEALEIFPQDDFNIALIDVNLGEKRTGTELLHTLRTMPNNESFYSIAFTAYALPSDHAHLLSEGFDDYLAKPFTKANLLNVLSRAVTAYV